MQFAPFSGRMLLFVTSALVAGGVVAMFAFRLYRQAAEYTDLQRPYFWACTVFAVGAITYGVVQIVAGDATGILLTIFALTTITFSFPWAVFALNCVGRGHLVTTRRLYVAMGYISIMNVVGVLDLDIVRSLLWSYPDLGVLVSFLSLGLVVAVFATCGLVPLSAYRHSSLALSHGAIVALPMLVLFVGVQLTRGSLPLFSEIVVSGVWLTSAVTLVLAPARYDVLTVRPGTGTVGERAAVREINEAIVTVERDGTLARANETARELFDEQLDDSFADLVGHEPSALKDQKIIECWTADGRKQFDPRVTVLTNGYDEVYGYTITLIDITDREMKRQRIEVLNRILRHNIRNDVSVIEARAELAMDPDQPGQEHLELITEVTEKLEGLSVNVRRIEKLIRGADDRVQSIRLDEVAVSVAEGVVTDDAVTVETELIPVSVQASPGLVRYALRQVIENAIEHNDSDQPCVRLSSNKTSSGVEIVVGDNGSGIPQAERDVILSGSETSHDHGSSIGLWGTTWAVQQLGGDLSFRESDLGGASVVIELPIH